VANLVVAQKHAERLAPRVAELLLVDVAKELARVDLQGLLQVAPQLLPRDVEHPDLDVLRAGRLLDQVVQPAPGGLELLEGGMVQDRLDLALQQRIQSGEVPAQESGDALPRRPAVQPRSAPDPECQGLPGRLLAQEPLERASALPPRPGP